MQSNQPSPKRKRRAGLAIVVIVLLIIAATFVGMNLFYVQEPEETPPAASRPMN